jgi:hypothetical protein
LTPKLLYVTLKLALKSPLISEKKSSFKYQFLLKGEQSMPNENAITSVTREFLSYLSNPTSIEELDHPRDILYHPAFKKFKKVCFENQSSALKTMEYIAKNISSLDMFKVGLSSSLFQEALDYENPSPFVANFTIGILLRSLILSDRYLFKALNYIENQQIMKDAPSELKAWKSLEYVLSSGIIILASSPMARIRLRENKNYYTLIEKMKVFIKPLEDIFKLYRLTDHYEFLLIHPEKLIGFKCKVVGIQNNYHLFTLIQEELSNKAGPSLSISKTTDSNAIAIAKGHRKFDIERKIPVLPLFDFYVWDVCKNGDHPSEGFHLKYLLKGSASPLEIPGFRGQKIIIFKDATDLSSSWDTHEFKPFNQHLTSKVTLSEALPKDDVLTLLRSFISN